MMEKEKYNKILSKQYYVTSLLRFLKENNLYSIELSSYIYKNLYKLKYEDDFYMPHILFEEYVLNRIKHYNKEELYKNYIDFIWDKLYHDTINLIVRTKKYELTCSCIDDKKLKKAFYDYRVLSYIANTYDCRFPDVEDIYETYYRYDK